MARSDRWNRRAEGLALLLLSPVVIFATPQTFGALLLIPIMWMGRRLRGGQLLPRTPHDLAIWLMLLMAAVSVLVSPDVNLSLPALASLIYGVAVFYTVVHVVGSLRAWVKALALFIVTGMVMAAVGLAGARTELGPLNMLGVGDAARLQVAAMAGARDGVNPNEVAGVLTWLLPPLVALILAQFTYGLPVAARAGAYGRLSEVLASCAMLLMGGLVLALTRSRGGILALAVAGLAFVLAALPGRFRGWALLCGTTLLALAALAGSLLLGPDDIARAARFGVGSISDRLELWSRALFFLKSSPISGIGMNAFGPAVHELYPVMRIATDRAIEDAHNELLQAGLDLGVVGLVGFFGLYTASAWVLWQIRTKLRAVEGGKEAKIVLLLALGLGVGLAAHAIYGLTDAVALGAHAGNLFWFLLALIASLYRLLHDPVSGMGRQEPPLWN